LLVANKHKKKQKDEQQHRLTDIRQTDGETEKHKIFTKIRHTYSWL